MSVRSCRVTIQDLDGNSHTAEVTASSLFEAVAQGLSALRKNEWVEGIEERFGFVKVSVADVRVEHQVKIADFMKWLEGPGRTPREITQRQRIRAILGMSVSRSHASPACSFTDGSSIGLSPWCSSSRSE